METLWGIHSVREALAAGRRDIHRLWFEKKRAAGRLAPILSLAGKKKVPAKAAGPDQLARACQTRLHQGVCLETGPYPLADFGELAASGDRAGRSLIVLLDQIVDPHNLGAILRTALCAGARGVVIPRDRSAGPSPSVSRASAGALEHIRLARAPNMAGAIQTLKKKGFWVFGAAADGAESVFSTEWDLKTALVIGGEEKGLRPLVKKNCDRLVFIPMAGPVESLNASAAAAVILYQAAGRPGGPGD
ncbi:RNA methyltransferase, TrmH family, group 3 [Candidatus Desulfarcum epimagneticum]|uniref:RNA methyltransferase, TrmH family, group 3 n=1 Tax=uncultured Desulfobacteraceae bacterium TaxID=218296 RepID=A0A484HCI2_9BACT|nr:RNA methyltransferase, TrmH family, group 3 [uncultured Desulfobacteraceae bacterium]